jgi:uroporphyrinogen decarboxylase
MASSREIVSAIVRDKSCPERMGVFEWFWQDAGAAWISQGLPPGTDLFEHFDLDVREIRGSMFRTTGRPVDDEIVADEAETVIKRNGWGALHREWKNKPGVPEHLGFELKDERVWRDTYREGLLGLDLRRFPDWDGVVAAARSGRESGRFCVYQQMLVVEIMRRAMGDVIFLEAMVLEPAWIHDFCSVVTDNILLHLDYLIREAGRPDGVWTYDDMGYTRAPFFSPAMYREFIYPYHKRVGDFCRDHGLPFILHACGNIRPFLSDLAAAGVDMLHPLEAKAGQHVVEFFDAVAATGRRMAFAGNMDIRAFLSNDPAVLEAEILPKLRTIREKRIPYVFMSDHSIPGAVRLETYERALALFRANARY